MSIQNFRGFPGVGNPEIRFDGKNLLVYGENGSGKSSIFHALDQLFSIAEPDALSRQALIRREANVFSGDGPDKTSVAVRFKDTPSITYQPVEWTEIAHPADNVGATLVVEAAYRKAMLDYRALLAVNYKHLGGRINLFDAFTSVLARDMPVAFGGSEERLAVLWHDVLADFALTHVESRKTAIDARITAINAAIDLMLDPLKAETNRLLRLLGWDDLEIDALTFAHLSIVWSKSAPKREIDGQAIHFTLKQRGVEIDEPHSFLNEARQSGLALAIYLAGRSLASATIQPTSPKLLVLDDVLIGLDQSNRLPVLKLLQTEFSDWQITLLTHDRVWFEMARVFLPQTGDTGWGGLEIFEGVDATGGTHPVSRPLNSFDPVAGNIQTAREFIIANHEKAAAVHARMAFEQVLKKFCAKKGVRVAFKAEPRELNTEMLLNALKAWLQEPARNAQAPNIQPLITDVETARRVVLNAFSHSTPVTLARAEIEAAINAVEALHAGLRAEFP
ncbi:AAA family ATPase [Brevundimonas sp.]